MAEMVRDFNHMIDSLETLDREQRVTLASISHELRTPIAVLSARLHAICDGVIPVSDEEMRGLLDQSLHLGRRSRTCTRCRWLRSAGCRCRPGPWIWWRWSATR